MTMRSLLYMLLLASLTLQLTLDACVSPKVDPADAASDPPDDLIVASRRVDMRVGPDAKSFTDAGSFSWPKCGTTAFSSDELHYGHAPAVAPDGVAAARDIATTAITWPDGRARTCRAPTIEITVPSASFGTITNRAAPPIVSSRAHSTGGMITVFPRRS